MIGRNSPTAQGALGMGPGRGSIPIAPRESPVAMGRPPWHVRGRRRRTPRTAAQRRLALAFVAEHLEGRSVPSGFAGASLSALSSAVQSSVHAAAPLARNVVTAGHLGGPAVELAAGATAPRPMVEGAVPTEIGAVLDALDSLSKVVDAATVPVIPPINVSPASQASGAAVADVGAASTSPSIDVSATISASIALPPFAPAASNIVTDLVRALAAASDAPNGGASAGSGGSSSRGEGVGISIGTGPGLAGAEISA